MKSGPVLCSFVMTLIMLAGSPAEAQRRTLPGGNPSRTPINPAHERMKTEADQAYQSGNFERTVELTSTVLTENPQDDVALYLRGSARVEIGRRSGDSRLIREGIADARQAIGLGTANDINYYLPYLYGMTTLSAVEGKESHAKVAVDVAGQVLARSDLENGQRANLLYQRAMAHAQQNDFNAAITDYQEAVRLVPTHLGATVALADAFAAAGRTQEAQAAFDRAVNAFPSNPLVYNNRGMFLQQQGRSQDALVDFTRALELNPQFSVGYNNRGFALMELGDLQAAENDFTQAIRVTPQHPMPYSLRGTSRLLQGRLDMALEDYVQAVRLDDRNAIAHADLAFGHFFKANYAEALAAFDRAMSRNSELRYLSPWRVWCLIELQRSDEAQQQFAAVLEKEPQERDWIDHLLLYQAGQIDDEQLLKTVNTTDKRVQNAQTCEAHYFVGRKKAMGGDKTAAENHFQLALKTGERQLSAYRASQYALNQFPAASGEAASE